MKIKMIVTDLDGTLLREDKTISKRTLSALEQCRIKGIKTVYATGRGNSAATIAPHDSFDGFVHMNGATAHIGDERIYSKLIPIECVRDLLVTADSAGIEIVAEADGWHHANFNVSDKWSWIAKYKIVDFSTLDVEIGKIYAFADNPDVVSLIRRYLSDDLYLYLSRDHIAMVMHKDALKSKAVAALAEYWSIERHEIVAFGDDMNDIDLLKWCGTGVAMGNALDEVKAAADDMCDTNDNDGIAKWLECKIHK